MNDLQGAILAGEVTNIGNFPKYASGICVDTINAGGFVAKRHDIKHSTGAESEVATLWRMHRASLSTV